MPNIKPVSDLRNYGEVLRDVAIGQPVFLTKNGYGREYELLKARTKLLAEVEKGRRSGEEEGWIPAEDVLTYFEEKYHD